MKTLIAAMWFLEVLAFAGMAQAQTWTVVWVDAKGEVVAPFIGYGGPYLDDEGFAWGMDPENGLLDSIYAPLPLRQFFQTPDCTGPGYVESYGVFIRSVFHVAGLPGWWSRSDSEPGRRFIPASVIEYYGSCVANSVPVFVVSVSTLRAAPDDPPLLPFTPPFHIEKR